MTTLGQPQSLYLLFSFTSNLDREKGSVRNRLYKLPKYGYTSTRFTAYHNQNSDKQLYPEEGTKLDEGIILLLYPMSWIKYNIDSKGN
jgi:hypothetical protein